MLCPKTNDILGQLKSSSKSDTDETRVRNLLRIPTFDPEEPIGRQRITTRRTVMHLWFFGSRCCYQAGARFLPLLQSLRISFPSNSFALSNSILCSLSLSPSLSLFLSFSLSRVHDFSFFVYLYSSPLLKHPEEFTCTRLHSVRSTFDNLYLRRRINSCKNKVSYLKFHSMYSRNSYSVGRKVCNQTVDVHAFVGN